MRKQHSKLLADFIAESNAIKYSSSRRNSVQTMLPFYSFNRRVNQACRLIQLQGKRGRCLKLAFNENGDILLKIMMIIMIMMAKPPTAC